LDGDAVISATIEVSKPVTFLLGRTTFSIQSNITRAVFDVTAGGVIFSGLATGGPHVGTWFSYAGAAGIDIFLFNESGYSRVENLGVITYGSTNTTAIHFQDCVGGEVNNFYKSHAVTAGVSSNHSVGIKIETTKPNQVPERGFIALRNLFMTGEDATRSEGSVGVWVKGIAATDGNPAMVTMDGSGNLENYYDCIRLENSQGFVYSGSYLFQGCTFSAELLSASNSHFYGRFRSHTPGLAHLNIDSRSYDNAWDDLTLFNPNSVIGTDNGVRTFITDRATGQFRIAPGGPTPACARYTLGSNNAVWTVSVNGAAATPREPISASTSQAVTLFTLPPRGVVTGMVIKSDRPFTGRGFDSFTMSIGDSLGNEADCTKRDCYTSGRTYDLAKPPSDTNFLAISEYKFSSFAGSNVIANIQANQNLNTAPIAGQVEVVACWLVAP
jgi:hypothetical protein